MATFSASPAPRRSRRLRHGPTSPQQSAFVSNSRLGTPMNASDISVLEGSRASVLSSVMDVDDDEQHSTASDRITPAPSTSLYFAKSDQLAVNFYSDLPVEVMQVLRNADFYGGAYTGGIDINTGFALVASADTCFVWQHSQAVKGIPTCYIFGCPRDYDQTSAPLYGLIPYSVSREPGLVLVSPSGHIRLWDSISIGLAGGEHFSTSALPLSSDEYVTNLIRVDAQTFIASTSSGTLYRLMPVPLGGKLQLTTHAFARPTSSLSLTRIYTSFFSSSSSSSKVSEPGNVNAMAVGRTTADDGKDIWTLVDTRIQKWELKAEGWEDLLMDIDVSRQIIVNLRHVLNATETDDAKFDLELLDVAVDGSAQLVVLVSYAGADDSHYGSASTTRRFYAITRLQAFSDSFEVKDAQHVPYQSTSSSGAPMHPRIQLILDGDIVSVQFGDVVALVAYKSEYKERLELKSSTDRTLGVGIMHADNALLVLTSSTMLKAHIDITNLRGLDPETGKVDLIKSIMTQAIMYGPIPSNPLTFTFPPEVDEKSLMQGAIQISQSVLESDSLLILRNNDLHAQMTTRKERLSFLIHFINDNGVLGKISQTCRQKLAVDAEKLYAAHQLWLQHNDLLSTGQDYSILHEAIFSYMNDINESHHEDVIRAFFKLRVADLAQIIGRLPETVDRGLATTVRNAKNEFVAEANRVTLSVLNAASDYRDYNKGVYGISLPMVNPWTCDPAVIDVVQTLFDNTTALVESPSISDYDADLKAQLPDLATRLFASLHERLSWLASASQDEDASQQLIQEHENVSMKFDAIRPNVLETLRRNGHSGTAFTLAERYADFSSLAALCNRESVYPPESNPHLHRIQLYLELYQESFAKELYAWYIKHGELRVLFAQDEAHIGYMDKFFADTPNTSISWIHELGLQRYENAAKSLQRESEQTVNLASKQFMLSVGKLAQLAHIFETNEGPTSDDMMDTFHDDLDFVSIHNELRAGFNNLLEHLRGRQSLETQTDAVVKAEAAGLADRPALTLVFKDFVRNLLQGRVLALEDAVDVLSLKDNNTTPDHYAYALRLLLRDRHIPDARKTSAIRSVWRRVYIHDDWEKIQRTGRVPDSELNDRFRNTALYVVFESMISERYDMADYEADPSVALQLPTMEEITSRWPGKTPDDAQAILADYMFEADRLGELILDDVYDKVKVLAENDVQGVEES